jgi:hypothetical protein
VLPVLEAPTENPVGRGAEGDGGGKEQFKMRELFADERCSQAILGFLSTTDLERLVPKPAE